MNEQIQPLIDLLGGRFGWLPASMTWMAAFRLALKPLSTRLQVRLTAKMVEAVRDPEESRDWDTILHRSWYRTTAFVLDLVFSFKLPTHADFERLRTTEHTEDTERKGRPGSTVGALLLLCSLGCCQGCTISSANRVFPKPVWYWSAEAREARMEKAAEKARNAGPDADWQGALHQALEKR